VPFLYPPGGISKSMWIMEDDEPLAEEDPRDSADAEGESWS